VSLRRADVRFLLPQPVTRAAVLDGLDEWREGLREGGVEVVGVDDSPDLVVGAATGAPMVIVEGARRVAGYVSRAVVPLPGVHAPELLLPVGQRHAVRYATRRWRPETIRNVVARELLAHGVAPPGRTPVAVAAREAGPPLAIARAGIDAAEWFAAFGTFAHAHSRAALFAFAGGAAEPTWVVKFSRVPGLKHLFDLDEHGLHLAAGAGGVVARAAPRLVSRFELEGGLYGSAETAATGERLGVLLRAATPRAERLAVVERVASWIVDVGRETAGGEPDIADIRTRIGGRFELPDLPALASVFVHGDLTADNVFVDGDDLTVVDWESANAHGLPLWDLLYFLAEALATLDGARTDDERVEHTVRLFNGELESSAVLDRWVRAAGVPDHAVEPVATWLWLHQAAVEADHVERLGLDVTPPMWRLAEQWAVRRR
jgi:hypothetical protein